MVAGVADMTQSEMLSAGPNLDLPARLLKKAHTHSINAIPKYIHEQSYPRKIKNQDIMMDEVHESRPFS
jgi:hypothetical protein